MIFQRDCIILIIMNAFVHCPSCKIYILDNIFSLSLAGTAIFEDIRVTHGTVKGVIYQQLINMLHSRVAAALFIVVLMYH